MFLSRFFRKRPAEAAGAALYASAAKQARQPAFYLAMGAPDTLEGRFELYTLHVILLIDRLSGQGEQAAETSQAAFDAYVRGLDDALREIGVGDLSMKKKMKKLAGAFYGRLQAWQEASATLPDTATLGEAAAALLRTEQHLFPVLDPAARPVGLLTRNAILAAGGYDKGTPLARLIDRAPAIIAAADPADASLPLLEEGAPAVLVVTADGRFAGLITMDNLAELRVLAKRPRQRASRYRLTPEGTSR